MNTLVESVGLVLEIVAFAGMIALIVERLTEKFIKPALVAAGVQKLAAYAALVLGLAASLSFGLDLLTPIAVNLGIVPPVAIAGQILTGLMVGGGSNFIHDVWPAKKTSASLP